MLAIERKNAILNTLREEKHVVVSELAKQFDVSEETVRRDLDKLEKEGMVIKTYGGAVMLSAKKRTCRQSSALPTWRPTSLRTETR